VPRRARTEHPGAVYHVTSRGNAGQPIFADDHDRIGLLQLLAQVAAKQHWHCLAYCLMDNHYHLLVRTPEPTLSVGMHAVQSGFARRFNERHARTGHLFGSRYYRRDVESDEHVLTAAVYTVLNPVRAGLVRHPVEWPWSSYRATVGLEASFDSLRSDLLLEFIALDLTEARTRYERLVNDAVTQPRKSRASTGGT
jgi:REP-associated tyrosine transposase